MEIVKCESCGSPHIKKEGEYYVCESCGSKFKDVEENGDFTNVFSSNKSVWQEIKNAVYTGDFSNLSEPGNAAVDLICCVFLGYFGIHKLIRGKYVLGILYFMTGGLFVFGWIIDIIRYTRRFLNLKKV